MFFVVDKPKLQRIIAIVREDRSRAKKANIPFLRLKAENTELSISGGGCVTAALPATVYEPGVLFIKTTIFRKLIRTIKGEKFLSFQVLDDGLHFANILMPFRGSNMVLYPNPADAPESWPPPPPKAEQIPERKEPTLFDVDEEYIKNQSPPTVAGDGRRGNREII